MDGGRSAAPDTSGPQRQAGVQRARPALNRAILKTGFSGRKYRKKSERPLKMALINHGAGEGDVSTCGAGNGRETDQSTHSNTPMMDWPRQSRPEIWCLCVGAISIALGCYCKWCLVNDTG